ncbi:MAG: DUF2116 family Zn-ribbon domain-containing protein [Candidatus Bathyarchaeia archaeon]
MQRKEAQPSIPKHRHCNICGISISPDKIYCSKNCEAEYKKMSRRRTYTFILTLLIFPIIMILMLLTTRP